MASSHLIFLCFLVWKMAKPCQSCAFDFEDADLHNWTATGTAFNNQPTYGDNPTARNRGQPANQQGDWWIGGYENRPNPSTPAGLTIGDGPQGTLTFPPFFIVGCGKISFLIGGGCDINAIRAELVINKQVVRKATGKCTETMARDNWDVHEYVGKEAHLRLVDTSSGGWGHINFDDLRGDISCDFVRQNKKPCQSCAFDFEDADLHNWTATGTAFNNQPTYGDNPTARNRGQPANQQGDWWIGGYENRPNPSTPAGLTIGDGPQGTLTFPPFFIVGCGKISFLIGGGCDINAIRAELVINKQVVRKATGKCTETMARDNWDVHEYVGKEAHLRLVDTSSGGWGHINFDDLRGDISCDFVRQNKKPCQSCAFDFEDADLHNWTATGTAFNNQPTYGDNPTARNRGQPANQQGDWWIGGYENRPSPSTPAGSTIGDGPQGTLTSPPFFIVGCGKISFLIGGGCDINVVRAELVINEQVVRKATGKCTETMVRDNWDVHEYVGKEAHLRLVDTSSGGWGHINFDDLRGDISCENCQGDPSQIGLK